MRVTELQTFGVLTNNLARARARGLEFQQQVSTGKLVRQPSDDPSAFNHIALDKASLAAIEQRKRNIVFGQTRLDLSDTALSHAMTFGYDAMSNLTSQTDALGNVTTLEYNDFNRVKKIVYPAPSPSATPLEETFT